MSIAVVNEYLDASVHLMKSKPGFDGMWAQSKLIKKVLPSMIVHDPVSVNALRIELKLQENMHLRSRYWPNERNYFENYVKKLFETNRFPHDTKLTLHMHLPYNQHDLPAHGISSRIDHPYTYTPIFFAPPDDMESTDFHLEARLNASKLNSKPSHITLDEIKSISFVHIDDSDFSPLYEASDQIGGVNLVPAGSAASHYMWFRDFYKFISKLEIPSTKHRTKIQNMMYPILALPTLETHLFHNDKISKFDSNLQVRSRNAELSEFEFLSARLSGFAFLDEGHGTLYEFNNYHIPKSFADLNKWCQAAYAITSEKHPSRKATYSGMDAVKKLHELPRRTK